MAGVNPGLLKVLMGQQPSFRGAGATGSWAPPPTLKERWNSKWKEYNAGKTSLRETQQEVWKQGSQANERLASRRRLARTLTKHGNQ